QMQDNMKKLQDELGTMQVEGQSGAGMVKVVMTCKHEVKRVTIDPSLLKDDKEMLGPGRGGDERRGAQGRGRGPGQDVRPHRRPRAASGNEAAVLRPPSSLEDLIEALRCLPGVGPKSAQRIAYHLLQYDRAGAERLAQ